MPSRRHARELALQALYGAEVGHKAPADMIDETVGAAGEVETRTFVRDLVLGTLDHADESDRIIAPLLDGWTLDRLPTIDRIVLRMSVFELQHRDVPPPVVINEAVELAKKFSTEDSGRFINGVLSKAKS
ncbi:MAG: transcription antitermination factor NusB [Candidatus Velthaea sp.]